MPKMHDRTASDLAAPSEGKELPKFACQCVISLCLGQNHYGLHTYIPTLTGLHTCIRPIYHWLLKMRARIRTQLTCITHEYRAITDNVGQLSALLVQTMKYKAHHIARLHARRPTYDTSDISVPKHGSVACIAVLSIYLTAALQQSNELPGVCRIGSFRIRAAHKSQIWCNGLRPNSAKRMCVKHCF